MNENEFYNELQNCIEKILVSNSPKKLIVAGPGTGKSSLFKKAIEHYGGNKEDYLVLTFINNLEDELRKDIGDKAKVFTFHGYCHFLIRKYPDLRYGLKNEFYYYPPVVELVKSDWNVLNQNQIPKFIGMMRNVKKEEELELFINRGNYYNATGYDDSVFRVYKSLKDGNKFKEKYKLVIVDEYQDFNMLETSVLRKIMESNPVLIVGDDDQALYCQLRDSDPKFIRELFKGDDFEKFSLPYCLRCPKPVISAFDNIVNESIKKGILTERIHKEFKFFPPIKGEDSEKYPFIKLIYFSIQSKKANYFGKYIIQEIKKIPNHEIQESYDKNFPTVLIIGPNYYLETIIPILNENGFNYDFRQTEESVKINVKDGLKILNGNENSNLGWRIIMEEDKPDFFDKVIKDSINFNINITELLPYNFKEKYLNEAKSYKEKEVVFQEKEIDKSKPSIKLTTFEGAKGLSAQHVFICGLQNGYLPKIPNKISDIEVCKLLVAITRTRKQCHLIFTKNFAGKRVEPSVFLNWIERKNYEFINVNRKYWEVNI